MFRVLQTEEVSSVSSAGINQQKKPTVVIGLGKTGLACARFLNRKGESIVVTDSRKNPPELKTLKKEMPSVPVYIGGFNESAIRETEQIVISPGVSLKDPVISRAASAGICIYGDVELFLQNISAPVVAITGSNGKSTVTALLGDMAKKAGLHVSYFFASCGENFHNFFCKNFTTLLKP